MLLVTSVTTSALPVMAQDASPAAPAAAAPQVSGVTVRYVPCPPSPRAAIPSKKRVRHKAVHRKPVVRVVKAKRPARPRTHVVRRPTLVSTRCQVINRGPVTPADIALFAPDLGDEGYPLAPIPVSTGVTGDFPSVPSLANDAGAFPGQAFRTGLPLGGFAFPPPTTGAGGGGGVICSPTPGLPNSCPPTGGGGATTPPRTGGGPTPPPPTGGGGPTPPPIGGGPTPVPEPSAWALMMVGVAAIGTALRRRRAGRARARPS